MLTRDEVMALSGRELDAVVAEKVMGENLKPPRDLAMARIGSLWTTCTGRYFDLKTGEHLLMPSGESLRQPEGSDDWNDRYFLYVAEHLGDRISAEVDAYRLQPKPYSTSWDAMGVLIEHMRGKGLYVTLETISGANGFVAMVFKDGEGLFLDEVSYAEAATAPKAVAKAALLAVGEEMHRDLQAPL